MKIGCITWSHRLENLDLFALMDHYKNDCHLDGIELWNNSFSSTDDEYLKKLKEKSDELSLPIYSVASKCQFGDFSDAKIEECRKTLAKWLDIAKKLGASILRISIAGDDLRNPDNQDKVFKTLTDTLNKIPHEGIRVGIENQEPGVVQNSADVMRMVEKSNGQLFVVLDNGSFLDRKISPYTFMEDNLKYACVVHTKFFDINSDGSDNVLDYSRIKSIIDKSGYDGYLSIEYDNSSASAIKDVPLIADFMRKTFKE